MTIYQHKVARVSGVTGQDGSSFAKLLLEKRNIVHGIKRRADLFNSRVVGRIYWDNRSVIKICPRYFRPAKVEALLRDSSIAKDKFGWVPELNEIVQEMVEADLADAKRHALLKQHGYKIAVSVE